MQEPSDDTQLRPRGPGDARADAPPAGDGGSENAQLRPTRRGLFGLVGAGLAGLAIGGAAGVAIADGSEPLFGGTAADVVPFYGAHQAGIVTPAQDRLHFAAFRMIEGSDREDLRSLLRDWTAAAARLTRGEPVGEGAGSDNLLLPPDDTGEATGLSAGNLTLTFGLGRELFVGADGSSDPFGIRAQMPPQFAPLPPFPFDLLDATQSGGDLCVQACADDPQIAVHAIRNLARIAAGRAHIAWSQLGFGRTSSTSRQQETPRNLFGFKDGTRNVMADETVELRRHIWVGEDAPTWIAGGSYLVARKIRMTLETWDRASLAEQQRVFGRTKAVGGPLSGGGEFTDPDFTKAAANGEPAIDLAAHMRLAHPEQNDGVRLLRRGYNYVDGSNELGQLGGGLFFISYQNDPTSFVRVQRSLKGDLLNEYVRHVASGLWAVPRGVAEGEYLAERLFEA